MLTGSLFAQDVPNDGVNDSTGETMPRAMTTTPVAEHEGFLSHRYGGTPEGFYLGDAYLLANPYLQQANIAAMFNIAEDTKGESQQTVRSDWELLPAESDGYSGNAILKSHVFFIRGSTDADLTWYANHAKVGSFKFTDHGYTVTVEFGSPGSHFSSGQTIFTDYAASPYGTRAYYTEESQPCLSGAYVFDETSWTTTIGYGGISTLSYHIDAEAERPYPWSSIRARLYDDSDGLVWEEMQYFWGF